MKKNGCRRKAILEIAEALHDVALSGCAREFLDFLADNADKEWSLTGKYPWKNDDEYIKYIRRLLGGTPISVPIATVVVIKKTGEMLLERRSDDGKWTIPAGHLNFGESLKAAAQRELLEETGLTVEAEDLELLCEDSGSKHQYPNGDVIHSVKVVFVTTEYRGELRTNHESLELKFFDPCDLPENCSGTTRRIAAIVAKEGWSCLVLE